MNTNLSNDYCAFASRKRARQCLSSKKVHKTERWIASLRTSEESFSPWLSKTLHDSSWRWSNRFKQVRSKIRIFKLSAAWNVQLVNILRTDSNGSNAFNKCFNRPKGERAERTPTGLTKLNAERSQRHDSKQKKSLSSSHREYQSSRNDWNV